MNRTFRIIWSQALGAWVVVSELAKRRSKSSGRVDERVISAAVTLKPGSTLPQAWPLRVCALAVMAVMAVLVAGGIPAPAQAQYVIDAGITETVPGTHTSPWALGNRLTVGTTSAGGTLIIQGGGIVTSTGIATQPAGMIASGVNSVGTVTVTGAGSRWTMSGGELQLAYLNSAGGSATLNILNGGSVSTAGGYGIRMGNTGVATVVVHDANSVISAGAALDVAGGSSLTVSNGGRANATNLRIFGSGVVNIGAGAGSPAAAAGTLSTPSLSLGAANSLLVLNHTNTSGTYTFGVASGSAPVISGLGQIQAYHGTTVLSRNNTYTGGTVFNGGILQVSANANLGGAAGVLTFNGGTLKTTAGFSMARVTTLNAGGGTIETQAGTLTQAGVIGGAGALTKTGAGILTLTGDNTYTGNTVINDGTLTIGNGGTTGSLGTGTVNIANPTSTLSFNRSDTVLFTGTLSGPGTFAQIGTGTTTLSSASNSVGATILSAGTLDLNGGLTTATIAMSGTSTLNVDGDVQAAGATPTAITGSAGADTVTVGTDGVLQANGDLGDGSDTLTVAGTVTGTGTIDLSNGDDTLTLNDGAVLNNIIDGGAHDNTDTVVLNNTSPLSVDGSKIVNFENMDKNGSGAVTLTGTMILGSSIHLNAGTLDVAGTGTVEAGSVVMLENTTLNVDGTLGGADLTILGTLNATVRIRAPGTLTATGNLGDGNDLLEVLGRLNVPESGAISGVFGLGDGDDQFIMHDGVVVNGVVHGGSSFDGTDTDTFTANISINSTASVGALPQFEVATKTGGGTLNITGGSWRDTELRQLNVLGGTLNIGPDARVAANADQPLDTVVASGATLNVDGLYTGSTGSDTLTVAGTVTGTGTIDLSDGDDTLTLQDGADVSGLVNQVNGGGGTDTLESDIALTAILGGGAINFETLTKTNVGTLNIDAPTSSAFTTVNVDGGRLQISNASNVSDVTTTRVASGATLNVDGSYTGSSGDDDMTVAGIVSGSGPISLDTGDDTLTLLDGAVISGTGVNGGGGTSDTVVLDNASTLSVDVSNISNFNFLQKDNVGTAVLTGTQSFSSGIAVNNGTLLVNGNLTGSAPMTVASGATLGGSGTIGGSVAITNGILGPGNSPGTLTINGDLSLTNASTLNYELGQAGVVGGALNDHTIVNGNLTLDGTLNVSTSAGGTYGAGLYRLISYGGTFTDNGLTLGTMPGGTNYLQTSIANQINLINTDGLTFTLWDGVAGPKNNSVINGGNGLWQHSTGNDNWTDVSGAINAQYTDNAFALFTGAAGTVNVDNTLGAVNSGGMQFAIDGYAISGDPLVLGGGTQTTIRVGDGTALGVGYTATINSNLSGATQLVKTDLGTLVLSGTNSYTGGTAINGGVVQVSTDANLGDAAGGLSFDNGTLQTGAALTTNRTTTLNAGGGTVDTNGFDSSMDGVIGGAGVLSKAGAGILTLTNTNTYTGATNVNGGTLQAGAAAGGQTFGVKSVVTLADVASASLDLNNFDQTIGSLSGGGSTGGNVTLGSGTLTTGGLNTSTTFAGSITGSGGLVKIGTGTQTLTAVNSIGATTVNGGTLDIEGVLDTSTVTMGNSILNIDGTLQASGATQAVFTGTAGTASTLLINSGGTLLANGDLGDGDDFLNISGTLDTGGSVFSLGDGADTFSIHDGTLLLGTVEGGAGADTFNTDINTSANLGAVSGFETLDKTGSGVLNLTGPGTSNFNTININQGSFHLDAAASLIAPVIGSLNTTVASGATLDVDGSYTGSGNSDSFILSGTVSGAGTIDLGGGDDTLTLNDGALLAAVISGGAHDAGDTVVLNNASALLFDAGNTINFEFLQKNNLGSATSIGTRIFSGGTAINGGTLDVDGGLGTPTLTMADDTVLNIDGSLQATVGTAAVITGSSGVNAVTVGGTLFANADMGDGNDVLDVAGTLDTDGGTFFLGTGDDNFVVHDGSVVGTVDGGTGFDTRTYNINASATLGSLLTFEGVTKTGTGVLNVTGPGVTDLQAVQVLGSTLNVQAGASVVATIGESLNTLVASGATLNVDGEFGCGDLDDTLDVSGTLSGSGTINLCGGDDTLILNDGASISGLANPIDGSTHNGGDRVILNNASVFIFDASDTINFEFLQKDNSGIATLTGAHGFTGVHLNGGTLDVDGALETSTLSMADNTLLNVDGSLQAGGGTAAVITGSSGINSVNVAVGAWLIASGDLGDGADVLDVRGTLDSDNGNFSLGAGDDTFMVFDATDASAATVDGGAGNDTFSADLASSAVLGGAVNFETLTKTNAGVLHINGPALSDFTTVNIDGGTLDIGAGGSISGVAATTVANSATLKVDGIYSGSAGNDTMTVNGTISGTGTIAFASGDDLFTLNHDADLTGFSGLLDGGSGYDELRAVGQDLSLGGVDDLQVANWETLALTRGSRLNQGGDISIDLLSIDASSVWVPGSHLLSGSVENAGRIEVGQSTPRISGDYRSVGNAGVVALDVSFSKGSSGVLSIDGDVVGQTALEITSDGSGFAGRTEPILVINSPNDNPATAGGFGRSSNGPTLMRFDETLKPWLFSQEQDNNWYLNPADIDVLPEVPGYGSGVTLSALNAVYLQQLADSQNGQLRECFMHEQTQRSSSEAADYCGRSWLQISQRQLDVDGGPGVPMDGEVNGVYLGVDNLDWSEGQVPFYVGGYLSYQRGDFELAPDRITGLRAELDSTASGAGLYGGWLWDNAVYLELNGSVQLPQLRVLTDDGSQQLDGQVWQASATLGQSLSLSERWRFDPFLSLTGVKQSWSEAEDFAKHQVNMDPDVWTTAQGGARLTYKPAVSESLRGWLELSVQETLSGGTSTVQLSAGEESASYSGHEFGSAGNLAAGIMGEYNNLVEWNGTITYSEGLSGTGYSDVEASLGLRVQW